MHPFIVAIFILFAVVLVVNLIAHLTCGCSGSEDDDSEADDITESHARSFRASGYRMATGQRRREPRPPKAERTGRV